MARYRLAASVVALCAAAACPKDLLDPRPPSSSKADGSVRSGASGPVASSPAVGPEASRLGCPPGLPVACRNGCCYAGSACSDDGRCVAVSGTLLCDAASVACAGPSGKRCCPPGSTCASSGSCGPVTVGVPEGTPCGAGWCIGRWQCAKDGTEYACFLDAFGPPTACIGDEGPPKCGGVCCPDYAGECVDDRCVVEPYAFACPAEAPKACGRGPCCAAGSTCGAGGCGCPAEAPYPCGSACCAEDERCDPVEGCIGCPDDHPLLCGAPDGCCLPGAPCGAGHCGCPQEMPVECAGVCCPPKAACWQGECRTCPDSSPGVCGEFCCKGGEACCASGVCCPAGRECCGGACCAQGMACQAGHCVQPGGTSGRCTCNDGSPCETNAQCKPEVEGVPAVCGCPY